MKTDSLGNRLPEVVYLMKDSDIETSLRALSINTFLLAVNTAISNGKIVTYDAALKSATISDNNIGSTIVSHL